MIRNFILQACIYDIKWGVFGDGGQLGGKKSSLENYIDYTKSRNGNGKIDIDLKGIWKRKLIRPDV